MRVIARRTLRSFYEQTQYSDSRGSLEAWYHEAIKAEWRSPDDIKAKYRHASFVRDKVVFNIAGNKYRLIVKINYPAGIVFIKFVGTHREYDRPDVKEL